MLSVADTSAIFGGSRPDFFFLSTLGRLDPGRLLALLQGRRSTSSCAFGIGARLKLLGDPRIF